jgi:hypothetical protein
MSTVGAINQALQGIQSAGDMVERSATNISRLPVDGDENLPQDVVTLSLAKTALRADAAVVKTAEGMDQSTIDIVI